MTSILDESDEATWREVIASQSQIFETMHECQLYAAHNELLVYAANPIEEQARMTTRSDEEWLRKGSNTAFLTQPQAADSAKPTADGLQQLARGDVLIFEEVRDPSTGVEQRKDPKRRHAVRLTKVIRQQASDKSCLAIEWAVADALPFDLFVGRNTSCAVHCGAWQHRAGRSWALGQERNIATGAGPRALSASAPCARIDPPSVLQSSGCPQPSGK